MYVYVCVYDHCANMPNVIVYVYVYVYVYVM